MKENYEGNELKEDRLARFARFLFEGAILKKTWRTGYAFLGQGRESVAEHTFGMMLIAMILARLCPEADELKLLKLCLLHDVPEARTGDANAVHKRYVVRDETRAVADMVKGLEGGEAIKNLIYEFNEGQNIEAKLARDADQLDMILSLKTHSDTGSNDADIWMPYVKGRLVTNEAKRLADAILSEHWSCWWMSELLGECGG